MFVNSTFSTRQAAVSYLQSQGFHQTETYVIWVLACANSGWNLQTCGGSYTPNTNSFTKHIQYQEHPTGAYRIEGFIRHVGSQYEVLISDGPEPNPEVLNYQWRGLIFGLPLSNWEGPIWSGYVLDWHTNPDLC
jgi:hypothetical protein